VKLEDQVKQLTDLMADLIPTVDRLAQGQQLNTKAINQLVENTRIISHSLKSPMGLVFE
jgi:hypothetical protein